MAAALPMLAAAAPAAAGTAAAAAPIAATGLAAAAGLPAVAAPAAAGLAAAAPAAAGAAGAAGAGGLGAAMGAGLPSIEAAAMGPMGGFGASLPGGATWAAGNQAVFNALPWYKQAAVIAKPALQGAQTGMRIGNMLQPKGAPAPAAAAPPQRPAQAMGPMQAGPSPVQIAMAKRYMARQRAGR